MLAYKRTLLAVAALLLFSCQIMHAQFFITRYSRSIGLGDAYTGVAEGIETTFSNDAGLAAIDFYGAAYSSGQGSYITADYSAYDLAVIAPLDPRIGTIAISYHGMNTDITSNAYWNNSLMQAHMGRAFGEGLAFGASLNYYRLATNVEVPHEGNNSINSGGEVSTAVDFGLSALYTAEEVILPSWNDVLKAGMRINNLRGPESQLPSSSPPILQEFSLGASYRISPMREKVTAHVPVTILLAAALHYDNSIRSERNTYDAVRASLGIEVQVLGLLQLRCGREEQRFLPGMVVSDPQHPVTSFGAGIVVPIGELIAAQSEYRLRLDYSHSIRENEDDLARMLLRSSFLEPQKNTFTLQLEFKP